MKKIAISLSALALVLVGGLTLRSAQAEPLPEITVYKSPSCGCCNGWIEHLEEEGFTVKGVNTDELMAIKTVNGVTPQLSSCHTALVDGVVVEGHVPAETLKRFLAERPEGLDGLAVPGMPIGSPGMEVPGQADQPYDVIAFSKAGGTQVYDEIR